VGEWWSGGGVVEWWSVPNLKLALIKLFTKLLFY
jgi:hypothetical protein